MLHHLDEQRDAARLRDRDQAQEASAQEELGSVVVAEVLWSLSETLVQK